MNELLENKYFLLVVILCVALLGVVVGGKFFINRISDKVIDKLQSEYTPGPYSPGYNPDKVDPNLIQQRQRTQQIPSEISPELDRPRFDDRRLERVDFMEEWEQQRLKS